MATALQLVNRVRRKYRFHDVSAFSASDRLTQSILDSLNEAIREILEEKAWPFDERYDGVLTILPRVNLTNVTTTNGTTSVVAVGQDLSSFYSVLNTARVVITSDTSYPNTAIAVRTIAVSGGNSTVVLNESWPGDTSTGETGYILSYEYGLPSTVKSIFAARHDETPLFVETIEPGDEFVRDFPRPHETQDTRPEILRVGGTIFETVIFGGTPTYPQRVAVYPAPTTTGYQIEYAYTPRRADLAATTTELDGVPDTVEDLIVELTYAKLQLTVGNDPQLGAVIASDVRRRVDLMHKGLRPGRGTRSFIRPIDRTQPARSTWGWGRLPRTFGSL